MVWFSIPMATDGAVETVAVATLCRGASEQEHTDGHIMDTQTAGIN